MSDTPVDDNVRLDRQDLTLDPDGMLDVPSVVEDSERAKTEAEERRRETDPLHRAQH